MDAISIVDLPLGLHPFGLKKGLDRIRLDADTRQVVDEFIEEQRARQLLLDAGIDPRHKMLLMGPPGNGKTVLAGAIAIELGVRSFEVRYDELISKVPNETSANLMRLFDFAAEEPTLVFFDEFDALGRERDDAQETGEMKRVVSTLLIQLNNVPSHVVCVAATNHYGMLDQALWRRFNVRLELPKPPLDAFPPFMREILAKYGHRPREGTRPESGDVDYEVIVMRNGFENLSDAELFCENSVRGFVMSRGALTIEQAIAAQTERWGEKQKRRST